MTRICFPYLELIPSSHNPRKRDVMVTRNPHNMITVHEDDTVSNKDTRRNSRIRIVMTCIGRSPSSSTDLENPSYSEEPFPSVRTPRSTTNVTQNVKFLLTLHVNKLVNSGPPCDKGFVFCRHVSHVTLKIISRIYPLASCLQIYPIPYSWK